MRKGPIAILVAAAALAVPGAYLVGSFVGNGGDPDGRAVDSGAPVPSATVGEAASDAPASAPSVVSQETDETGPAAGDVAALDYDELMRQDEALVGIDVDTTASSAPQLLDPIAGSDPAIGRTLEPVPVAPSADVGFDADGPDGMPFADPVTDASDPDVAQREAASPQASLPQEPLPPEPLPELPSQDQPVFDDPVGLTESELEEVRGALMENPVRQVTRVPFPPVVGGTVPPAVFLHRIPDGALEAAPRLAGRMFVVIEDQIVIIDGDSREILSVFPI